MKAEYEKVFDKKPRGPNTIEWLKSKIDESKKPKSELELLKEEYLEKLGKKASGPKANDIDWIKSKIQKFESRSDEEIELSDLKVEYFEKLGKKPSGPKANDIGWLKSKIEECSTDGEASDGEASDDKATDGEASDEGSSGDSVGKFDFVFEGVTYTRIFEYSEKVWKVEDDDGNEVGEWVDKIPGDNDDGRIEWNDETWEEIHKEHDNYNGEE